MTDLTFNIVALGDAFTKIIALGDSVERLSVKLDELGRKVATPKVDVDTTAATAKIDELNRKINSTQGLSGGVNNVQTALIGLGAALGAGALSGAALLAIPAGVAAIGIAAVRTNVDVRTAFTDMTTAAKVSLTQGFAPFVPTLVAIAGQGKAAFAGLTPVFSAAAAATAPLLQSVSTGLIKATTAGVGATVPLLQGMGQVAQSLGNDFVQVEHGVMGLLGNLDFSGAANGLSILGSDIEQLLPAIGGLIAEVTPLANALLADLGPALTSAAHDLLILTPILNAAAAVISFLGPDISTLGPPLLAVMGITKLMTGSWVDFGGAVGKVKPLVADFGGTLDTIGQKLGYTSKATNEARAAEAASVLTKAELTKAAQEQAVAEAAQAYAADASAKNALALNAAQNALAASSKVAATAETELAATSEAATFSFGPLGIALAGIALLAAPFIMGMQGSSQAATNLAGELGKLQQAASDTQALSHLFQADPNAEKQLSLLQKYGITLKDLASAQSGDVAAQQQIADAAKQAADALNAKVEAEQRNIDAEQNSAQVTKSRGAAHDAAVAALNRDKDALSADKSMLDIANQTYRDAKTQVDANTAAQGTLASTQQQAAGIAGALGLNIDTVSQALRDMASGTKYAMTATQQMSDTFLTQTLAVDAANSTVTNYFKQADQAAQQASQSLVDANHSYAQSVTAVGDAQHAAAQADQAVITARQGVVTAQRSVTDALANEVIAENNVTKAQVARTQAQVNLNTATRQAVEQLKALHLQMADQVTSEESARIALFDQLTTSKVLGVTPDNAAALAATPLTDANKADEGKIKSAIDLLKAEQAVNNALNTGSNLREQVAAADKAGVAGSQGVISAQNALASAQDQVASSAQALVKAHQAVDDAQANVKKSEQGVTDALYNERKAHQAVADAVYNQGKAYQAIAIAQAALTKAQDDASRSMDIHTAAGQRTAGMLKQVFDQLSANEDPQKTGNDLIKNAASLFGISTGAAQAYLTQLGLIPTNFKFGLTAVAAADFSQLNASYATIIARGVNATAGLPVPHATGGVIGGIGGPRDDANLIWASTGEFMQPADAHDYYGTPFMEAVRHKKLPKDAIRGFAAGGLIGDLSNALGMGALGDLYQTAANTYGVLGVPSPPAPKSLPKYVAPAITASGATLGTPSNVSGNRGANKAIMQQIFAGHGWGSGPQWAAQDYLEMREAGYNNLAQNPTSTAFGMGQFLDSTWAGFGPKTTDPRLQSEYMARYEGQRYGDPIHAAAHELSFNWYRDGGPVVEALRAPKVRDNGGPIDPGWNMIYNGTGRAENSRSGAQEDALLTELRQIRGALSDQRALVGALNVHPPAGASVDAVANEVMRRLEFHMR